MLHGIDISNWQKGIVLPERLDFCIVKATEGFRFVDPYCDGFVQQCISKGILYGFYHFARNNDPITEARFFRSQTIGYELCGIPVLDIEDDSIVNWGAWAQVFVDTYHAITGVYPLIYASASTLGRFAGYPLTETCDLWIAGYPDEKERGLRDVPDFPYDVSPWKYAAIWQYTANGWLSNWDQPVDMDVAYMDVAAWKLYANPASELDITQVKPKPETEDTSQKPTWTFENGKVRVDVTLKGGEH